MTADRGAMVSLLVGLLALVTALIGFQVLGGQQEDAPIVGLVILQSVGIAWIWRRVRRARLVLLGLSVVEFALVMAWIVAVPHTGGPFGQQGADLPYGGHWVLLGLVTALATFVAALLYRGPSLSKG